MKPLLLLLAAVPLFGAYTNYYNDGLTNGAFPNWTKHGSGLAATPGGLTGNGSGGYLLSTVAIPTGPTNYEVRTVLTLSGTGSAGTFTIYLRATDDPNPNATIPASYYSINITPYLSANACTADLTLE